MRLKPKDVHAQTFRVTFRGFDPVEVDGFLNRVSDELERLSEEKSNLELELEVERASRKSLEETLENTTHLQEVIVQRAKEEARLIKEHARLEALETAAAAREEIAALKRELALIREKRASALADVAGTAHGLAEWARRFNAEVAQDEAPPAAREVRTAAPEAVKPDSVYEDIITKPAPEPVYPAVPLEPHRAAAAPVDELSIAVNASPAFVLHDDRSQMVMDLAHDPEAYNPARVAESEGPVPDQDSENIEIIENFNEDEDSWK